MWRFICFVKFISSSIYNTGYLVHIKHPQTTTHKTTDIKQLFMESSLYAGLSSAQDALQ